MQLQASLGILQCIYPTQVQSLTVDQDHDWIKKLNSRSDSTARFTDVRFFANGAPAGRSGTNTYLDLQDLNSDAKDLTASEAIGSGTVLRQFDADWHKNQNATMEHTLEENHLEELHARRHMHQSCVATPTRGGRVRSKWLRSKTCGSHAVMSSIVTSARALMSRQ